MVRRCRNACRAQSKKAAAHRVCSSFCCLVPRRGLEPPRSYPLVPETSASTNSATWAFREAAIIGVIFRSFRANAKNFSEALVGGAAVLTRSGKPECCMKKPVAFASAAHAALGSDGRERCRRSACGCRVLCADGVGRWMERWRSTAAFAGGPEGIGRCALCAGQGALECRAGKEKAAAQKVQRLMSGAQERTRTSTELPAST